MCPCLCLVLRLLSCCPVLCLTLRLLSCAWLCARLCCAAARVASAASAHSGGEQAASYVSFLLKPLVLQLLMAPPTVFVKNILICPSLWRVLMKAMSSGTSRQPRPPTKLR